VSVSDRLKEKHYGAYAIHIVLGCSENIYEH
jgi:hypothetical protein